MMETQQAQNLFDKAVALAETWQNRANELLTREERKYPGADEAAAHSSPGQGSAVKND